MRQEEWYNKEKLIASKLFNQTRLLKIKPVPNFKNVKPKYTLISCCNLQNEH